MKNNICVIGLGYIGLPTLLLLAKKNYNVTGYDINKKVISSIKQYKNFKTERDISLLLKKIIVKKKINLTNKFPNKGNFDTYIICVPTPIHKINKKIKPDLKSLISVVKKLANVLKNDDNVIIESTVPVGTTEKINTMFSKKKIDKLNINLAYCPERVLPGNIIHELIHNQRIIGGINKQSTFAASNLYKSFVKGRILLTDSKTAEMIKLTENSFRDVNIAFANEISLICKKNNINTDKVIKMANLHPRVSILKPGIGVGGHCIPVDPWFLIQYDENNSKLLKAARNSNIKKTNFVVKDIKKTINAFVKENKKKPIVSFFGLTYKKDTNDIRNSPCTYIIDCLKELKNKYYIVDPYIYKYKNVFTVDSDKAFQKSDIIIILNKHTPFEEFFSNISFKNRYN